MSTIKQRYVKVAETGVGDELQYNQEQPRTSAHPTEDWLEKWAQKIKDTV